MFKKLKKKTGKPKAKPRKPKPVSKKPKAKKPKLLLKSNASKSNASKSNASKKQSKPKKPKTRPKKPKAKSRKPKKPVFERRHEEIQPPEGYDINLGDVSQDEAYASILGRLEDAKANLPEGYEGRIIIHPYADGSVDGELYVKVDERPTRDVEFDLYEAFTSLSVGRRYWISTGARYEIKSDDEVYRKFRGLNQVQTNYQRATPTNIVEEHLLLRKKIIGGMESHYKREAHSVFIRLHWNPKDEQPKR